MSGKAVLMCEIPVTTRSGKRWATFHRPIELEVPDDWTDETIDFPITIEILNATLDTTLRVRVADLGNFPVLEVKIPEGIFTVQPSEIKELEFERDTQGELVTARSVEYPTPPMSARAAETERASYGRHDGIVEAVPRLPEDEPAR